MLDSSISSIFFKLANFFILIGLGYYIYKKYIKSSLEEQVSQKEAILKGLEEQRYFLEGRSHELDEIQVKQEQYAKILVQKVDEWRDAVMAEHVKMHDENRVFVAQAAERLVKKNNNFSQQVLYTTIAPLIIKETRELLQKQFSNKVYNSAFAHEIIDNLKRRV